MTNPVSELFAAAVDRAARQIEAPKPREERRNDASGRWKEGPLPGTPAVNGHTVVLRAVAKKTGVGLRTLYRWTDDFPLATQLYRYWAACDALGIPLEDFHAAIAEHGRLAAKAK